MYPGMHFNAATVRTPEEWREAQREASWTFLENAAKEHALAVQDALETPAQTQAQVDRILQRGEALDRAVIACRMHGYDSSTIARVPYLHASYVQELLANVSHHGPF